MKKKQRPPIGLYLKQRDVNVVKALWRYRIARESTLHRRCFPTVAHQRKVQTRLKQLCEEGYIDRRFPHSVHRDNQDFIDYTHQDRREVIYWIERLGVEEVLHGQPPNEEQKIRLRWIKNLHKRKEHKLNHPLDLVDVRACLELAIAQTPGVLLAAWYDEHDGDKRGPILEAKVMILNPDTGKKRPFTLCPDACFILEEGGSGRQDLFFVEVDEDTEYARDRWRDKVLAYIAYFGHGFEDAIGFQGEDFRVLTVARRPPGKEQEKRRGSLMKTTFRVGGRGRFWFTTFEALMPGDIVTGEHFLTGKIWQRARKEEMEQQIALALRNHLFV